MTYFTTRKSKYGLSDMEVGEERTFDTPTERDKDGVRRSAHNLNIRTERYYMTRSLPKIVMVTRIR